MMRAGEGARRCQFINGSLTPTPTPRNLTIFLLILTFRLPMSTDGRRLGKYLGDHGDDLESSFTFLIFSSFPINWIVVTTRRIMGGLNGDEP